MDDIKQFAITRAKTHAKKSRKPWVVYEISPNVYGITSFRSWTTQKYDQEYTLIGIYHG